MPLSEMKWVKRYAEFRRIEEIQLLPSRRRGIYALLKHRPRVGRFDVVYIGLAAGPKASIRGRLRAHARSRKKKHLWTHFSVFEVWENIYEDEVRELEGLFRHIYRKDSRANRLNRQRKFKKLRHIESMI